MTGLLLTGVLAPFLLGNGLAIICAASSGVSQHSHAVIASVFAALAIPIIYWFLEGMPPFPPVASKHKLGYVLCFGGVLAISLFAWTPAYRAVIAAIILGASICWIGIRKLSGDDGIYFALWFILPLVIFAAASHLNVRQSDNPYLWPVTTLIFAIAAAIVSLLGGYIGMAQMSGAFAAFIGGYLLVRYAAELIGRGNSIPTLPNAVSWLILFAVAAAFSSSLLFAPKLNPFAGLATLLILLVPAYAARFQGLPSRIQPIAMASLALVPGLIAVFVPFLPIG
ncbi:MAG: hypothetical protein AAGE89_10020 [Pseudomonadota bacterium]